jgi:uncharacterized protein with FMN-binding domain
VTPASIGDGGDAEPRASRRIDPDARLKRNLVALATAGIVTVYAAGYARTESAAEMIERSGAARRPGDGTLGTSTDGGGSSGPVQASLPQPADPGVSSTSPATGAQTTSTPVAPAATQPSPLRIPAGAGTTPSPPSPGAPASAPARFKDGVYAGWGRSLHGNIEATVEIQGGRILSARISTCRTRWPCARIAYLVPQVAERQSQEVDVITGATESSDAFYYALVEALSKAK